MKKIAALFVMMVLCLTTASCKTIDGYHYDLDDARSESKLYNDYDYIFTKEQENAVIDFIIKGDELHIVQLKAVKRFSKPRYRVRDTSSYIIQQSISRCENADDYYWTNSTKLTVVNFDWCIVTKDFNITHSNYPSFEFQYGGVEYNLCYIINPAA